MFAFGTSERAHADLMLYGILNAACDASRGNPPSERDINQVLAAVAGIGAKDEIEGMLATQMVATHTAIITTLRRQKQSETLLEQEGYGNLAVKLLRTFAAQVEALQRYRGKGQQHIRVEHVDVHAGGQAIVGAVTAGEGGKEKSDEQVLHHQKLPMNRAPQCGARTRSGKPCRSPAVRGKRRCRMHGGAAGSGAPLGNKNAFRHGHYSAEAIARRRELSELIRLARDTLAELE